MTATLHHLAEHPPPPVTIELPDRFDVHRVPEVRAELDRGHRPDALVLIDASRVRFLDGAAIAALLEDRARRLDRGGDLRLVRPSTATRVTLELVGAWTACGSVPDRDRAVETAEAA